MATQHDLRFDTYRELVGQPLASSAWVLIDQDRINHFADCTGDHQWIHVDVARAAQESPFSGTIAHGFLTLSLLGDALLASGALPADAGRIINAGVDQVRFKAPVRAGKRVRYHFRLADVVAKGADRLIATLAAELEVEGETGPAVSADVTVMLFR